MPDHDSFVAMTFSVNVTSMDPNSNDLLVLQERDPVTHAVSDIATAAVSQGGGATTISNPQQPSAVLNDEFSLQLNGASTGSDYFTVESGVITTQMCAGVADVQDGTWG